MNEIKKYIAETIKECFNRKIRIAEIERSDDLRGLGLSSLNVIEVITALEEKYNIEVEEDDLDISSLCTVNDYYNVVQKYLENENEKERREAWNLVGGLFWQKGRVSARPSDEDISNFLNGAENKNIVVIGASTKYLIEKAIETGANVTIFDFSENMINDLKNVLGDKCSYILYDILSGDSLDKKFDLIISDRLVNRFTYGESIKVIKNTLSLLKDGGTVKHAIKLGYYKLDKNLIEYAKKHGVKESFFDEETKTIDYTKTKDFLYECIEEHGDISKDILYKWYIGRGRESRFNYDDVVKIIAAAGGKLLSADDYTANSETKIFCIASDTSK